MLQQIPFDSPTQEDTESQTIQTQEEAFTLRRPTTVARITHNLRIWGTALRRGWEETLRNSSSKAPAVLGQ